MSGDKPVDGPCGAELVRDEPDWTFPGFDLAGGPSRRRLRVWRTGPGRITAVLTEPDDAPGTSITNQAAVIYRLLEGDYHDAVLTLVEHYPHSRIRYSKAVVDPHGRVSWAWLDPDKLAENLPGLETE